MADRSYYTYSVLQKFTSAEWPINDLIRLVDEWETGASTSQIAIKLHRSKNSVVGKVHRLDLTARPSPIIRGGIRQEPLPRRATQTLPPLPSDPEPPAAVKPHHPAPARHQPPQTLPALASMQAQVPPRPYAPRPPIADTPALVRVKLRTTPCCWPIGNPRTPQFRMCDVVSEPGSIYCPTHAQRAFLDHRPKVAADDDALAA